MATIVTRASKGSALSWTEGDANITNLNNDKIELTDLSVGAEGAASGDGAISYNNTTGVFTYTPPDTSSFLTDYTVTEGDVTAHQAALSITESQISDFGTYLSSASSVNDLTDVNVSDMGDGDALVWNSSASEWKNQALISISNLTDLGDINPSMTPNDGQILVYSSANSWFTADYPSGMAELVDDLTPELGGDLDCGDNNINSAVFKDYAETIYNLGTTDSPTITIANGNVQKLTISSGLSLPAFSDAAAGQSVTLLVDGSGTVTGTLDYLFAGGATTLTTSSVISIFYDGTIYWASVATDFQ